MSNFFSKAFIIASAFAVCSSANAGEINQSFSISENGEEVKYHLVSLYDIDVEQSNTDGFLHSIVADAEYVYLVDNDFFDEESNSWIIKRFDISSGERAENLNFSVASAPLNRQFFLMLDSEGMLVAYFKPMPVKSESSPNPAPSIQTVVIDPSSGKVVDEYSYVSTIGFSYKWDTTTGQMAMYGAALGSHWYFLPLYSEPYINVVKYNYPDNNRKSPNYRAVQYSVDDEEPYSVVCPLNQSFYIADSGSTFPTLFAGNTAAECGSFDDTEASGNGLSAFTFNGHRFIVYGKSYTSSAIEYGLALFDADLPSEYASGDEASISLSQSMLGLCSFGRQSAHGGADSQHRQLSASAFDASTNSQIVFTYAPGKFLKAYRLMPDGALSAQLVNGGGDVVAMIDGNLVKFSAEAPSIIVYDITGRPIIEKRNASNIDLSTVSKGIYIISTPSKAFKFIKK